MWAVPSNPVALDNALEAVFHDGESAQRHAVQVAVQNDILLILETGADQVRWPLEEVREQLDHGWDKALVLFRVNSDARLVVMGSDQIAEIRAKCPALNKPVVARSQVRRLVTWGLGAVAALGILYFFIIPGLADELAEYIPPESEAAFGELVVGHIETVLGGGGTLACRSPDGLAALRKMQAVLTASEELPYDLSVRVMDHDMINAFAVPGGKVVLMRGLIEAAEAPEEVAAVLAHEIGHVAKRDPTRAALRTAGSAGILAMIFGDFAGGTVVVLLTEQYLNAQYSQALETGADAYAQRLMMQAGYRPDALATMFERLQAEHGDANSLMAPFLSHPQLSDRIDSARAAGSGFTPATEPILSDSEWAALRSICKN
ncbi:MAG: M48 family metallopeptidase [Pseudomonadota bacterium]